MTFFYTNRCRIPSANGFKIFVCGGIIDKIKSYINESLAKIKGS